MKTISLVLLTLSLLFSACSTLKVERDYDTSFDMTQLHKFAIIEDEQEFKDTLTTNRIDGAITQELKLKNYSLAKRESADFLIYYHISVKNKTQVFTDYQRVGMYPYRYRGMLVPTTHSYNYDEAQLIVDMIDPKDNNVIYRTSVKDELQTFDTPEEKTVYINKVIKSLLKDFPASL